MSGCTDDLDFRGLVHQMSDPALAKRLNGDRLTVYAGFDPTADSLHVGHLLGVLSLRRLQRAGHRPIALVGGGTGMVGDPGGKTEERVLLGADELAGNLAGIRSQLERLLDFGADAGESRAIMVDNGEWLWSVGLLEFLRDVGKHFTVNQMVAKESVRTRLEGREHGISFTEFSYMLLQAYDYLRLFDEHGCRLQVGGSDQWGNITMGIDLIRRKRSAESWGLTWPLIVRPDGSKLGKTEKGAVWLDAERTSPYELYQYFLRTEDALVGTYLRYFTFLDHERIAELDEQVAERPEERQAQTLLAYEVTAMVHGDGEASRAQSASRALFSGEIAGLDEATLLEVFSEAPSSDGAMSRLGGPGLGLVDAMVEAGLVSSKAAARRAISQGGAYINFTRERDPERVLTAADLVSGRYVVLSMGRKQHHLVRFA
jgi:tyrosyl-tRNA synthetase